MANEISRLELTTDPDQLAKLQRKLDEYAQRLALKHGPHADVDTVLKYEFLKELLETGSVNVMEFGLRMSTSHVFSPRSLDQAVQIIAAYNDGDTSMLRGGTGLK